MVLMVLLVLMAAMVVVVCRVQDVLHGEGQAFGGRIPLAGGTRRGGTGVRSGIAVHRSRQIHGADLLETLDGLGIS